MLLSWEQRDYELYRQKLKPAPDFEFLCTKTLVKPFNGQISDVPSSDVHC